MRKSRFSTRETLLTVCVIQCSLISCAPQEHRIADLAVGRVKSVRIDAGLVFRDVPLTLHFGIARFGVGLNDRITQVKSSCDCVVCEVITYLDGSQPDARALRITFHESDSSTVPLKLGVTLYIVLTDDRSISTEVEFTVVSGVALSKQGKSS